MVSFPCRIKCLWVSFSGEHLVYDNAIECTNLELLDFVTELGSMVNKMVHAWNLFKNFASVKVGSKENSIDENVNNE